MGNDVKSIVPTKAGSLAIWEGWFFGPVAWALHQNVSYGFTHLLCGSGVKWPLYTATLLAVAIAGAAGYLSWRFRQAASDLGKEDAPSASRVRFVATVGVLICALSAAGILVETIPVFVLDACAGAT